MKPARFSIYTSMERNAAIDQLRQAIMACGGWIENQTLFSNIAATINLEMPSTALGEFQKDLAQRGLIAHVEGELPSGAAGDIRSTVSLTFSHDEPDMKRVVPPFG
ncbi:MAG: hypothetical protein ABJM29_14925 [Rhizobiaceae bacterium]